MGTYQDKLLRRQRAMRAVDITTSPRPHATSRADLRSMLAQAAANTAAIPRDEERAGTREPESPQRGA